MSRADRRGSAGFQLAALVDLLFVITFLLICEREALMKKRVKKIQTSVAVAKEETRKAVQAKKLVQEELKAVEKERKKLEDERQKVLSAVTSLERVRAGDKSREKKLEKDLHNVFNWMIEGMRREGRGVVTQ